MPSYKQVATHQDKMRKSGGDWGNKTTSSLGSTFGPTSKQTSGMTTSHSDGFLPQIDQDRASRTDGFNSSSNSIRYCSPGQTTFSDSADFFLPEAAPKKDFAKTTSSLGSTGALSTGEPSASSKLQLAQDRMRHLTYELQDRKQGMNEANSRLVEVKGRSEAFDAELQRLADAKVLYEQQLEQIARQHTSKASPEVVAQDSAEPDPSTELNATQIVAMSVPTNFMSDRKLSSWFEARRREYSESLRVIERKTWDAKRRQHKYVLETKKLEAFLSKQEVELSALIAKMDDIQTEMQKLEDDAELEFEEIQKRKQEARVKALKPKKFKKVASAPSLPPAEPEKFGKQSTFKRVSTEGDLWQMAELANMSPRTYLADSLIAVHGSAKEATKKMDVNGNGKVSLLEFQYGLSSLNLPPKRVLQLFSHFDLDASKELSLREIFGDARADLEEQEEERVLTPCTMWQNWYKNMKKTQVRETGTINREPKWIPSRSQLISDLVQQRDQTQMIQDRKMWMKATMKRLKGRGLTDSACRELVAQHLPRGQGPKDSSGVRRLDKNTVKTERKGYIEKVQQNVNKIEKIVTDLSTQKTELRGAVRDLWSVTEKIQLARQEAEMLASGLGGLSLFGKKDGGGSVEDAHAANSKAEEEKQKAKEKEDAMIKECCSKFNIPNDEARNIKDEFDMLDKDNSGWIEKAEFISLMQKRQQAPLTEVDIENHWRGILRYKSSFSDHVGSGKEAIFDIIMKGDASKNQTHIAFEHFLVWYWENKDSIHT